MTLLEVHCASCGRSQIDEGKGNSCAYCGCSPLPSYSYPKGHAFYPRPKRISQQKRIEAEVARRREEISK